MIRRKTIPALSSAAATLLTDLHSELCAIIAAEVYRRRYARPYAEDIIQDALTRTCAAVAAGTAKDGPRSRARACALDALKTLARRLKRERSTFSYAHFDASEAPITDCFNTSILASLVIPDGWKEQPEPLAA